MMNTSSLMYLDLQLPVLQYFLHLAALKAGLRGLLHGFQPLLAALKIEEASGQHGHQHQKKEAEPERMLIAGWPCGQKLKSTPKKYQK